MVVGMGIGGASDAAFDRPLSLRVRCYDREDTWDLIHVTSVIEAPNTEFASEEVWVRFATEEAAKVPAQSKQSGGLEAVQKQDARKLEECFCRMTELSEWKALWAQRSSLSSFKPAARCVEARWTVQRSPAARSRPVSVTEFGIRGILSFGSCFVSAWGSLFL